MFSYNNNIKEKKLFVSIPNTMKYNFNFLNSITELISKANESSCDALYISYNSNDLNFDKLSSAYFYNILIYLSTKKNTYCSRNILKILREQVSREKGEKFEKIDMVNDYEKDVQPYYIVKTDKEADYTSQTLVDFIAENKYIFPNAKEFLFTTIGEIFSNAFNHSNENNVFFMYGIETKNDKHFLVINILDYGKTIIGNVQEYQRCTYKKSFDSKQSLEWAMEKGHTTRNGSGGYGLPLLVDYINKIKGELLIFSGNGIYTSKNNHNNIWKAKGVFEGTSVSMKIPLDDSTVIFLDDESKELFSIDLDQI